MGNSLQDIITFGRRAGRNAATYIQGGVTLKGLSLDHVMKFEQELAAAGIEDPAIAPILLPDYATEEVVERRWTEALTDRAAEQRGRTGLGQDRPDLQFGRLQRQNKDEKDSNRQQTPGNQQFQPSHHHFLL